MEEKLRELEQSARAVLEAAGDLKALEQARITVFGKKGLLATGLPDMKDVPAAERPLVGKLRNSMTKALEQVFDERTAALTAAARAAAQDSRRLDVSLPGRVPVPGRRHPLTLVLNELVDIFAGFGFTVVDVPAVELSYYNFIGLAIAEDHPARDDRDSFYINRERGAPDGDLGGCRSGRWRTTEPPCGSSRPGGSTAATRSMRRSAPFHRLKGLLVDRGVSFAD